MMNWKRGGVVALMAAVLVLAVMTGRAEDKPSKESVAPKGDAGGKADYAKLAKDTLIIFNQAVQAKDFKNFYNFIAQYWQKQTTASELQKNFQAFIDEDIDISPIADKAPVWDLPASVQKDTYLTLTGHYELKPQVNFELKYQKEKGEWKLIGIDVRVFAPEKMVPFDSILGNMARETLLDFNKAVQAKDFTNFHKNISKVWQKQITPAKLKEVFQAFIDNNIDLSEIATLDPDIDEGADINGDGVLAFKGSFPTKPNKVFFELKYILESGKWKLLGINVNVK